MVVLYVVTLWFLAGWVFTCTILCIMPEGAFKSVVRDIWDVNESVPSRLGFVVTLLALWPMFAVAVVLDYKSGDIHRYD